MSFSELPFGPNFAPQRFPPHEAVQRYLEAYADTFALRPFISFGRKVVRVEPRDPSEGAAGFRGVAWEVTTVPSAPGGGGAEGEEEARTQQFDVVVVCNGHYSEPRTPELPGAAAFRGTLMHSHNYRSARPFAGRRVLVVGASASGHDISREIAEEAEVVSSCSCSCSCSCSSLALATWDDVSWCTQDDGATHNPNPTPDLPPFPARGAERRGQVVFLSARQPLPQPPLGARARIHARAPPRRLLEDAVEFQDGAVEQASHFRHLSSLGGRDHGRRTRRGKASRGGGGVKQASHFTWTHLLLLPVPLRCPAARHPFRRRSMTCCSVPGTTTASRSSQATPASCTLRAATRPRAPLRPAL